MPSLTFSALLLAAFFLQPPPPKDGGFVSAGTLKHDGPAGWVAFSPDGKRLTVVSPDAPVVWDVRTRDKVATLKHPGRVISAVFSPDRRLLVTVDDDKKARVWDVATTKQGISLPTRNQAWFAFSADGKLLVVSDWDAFPNLGGKVRLLDVATGEELADLPHTTGPVFGVVFSPDGKTLATSTWDRVKERAEVIVWDVAARRPRATLTGTVGPMAVAFSPDGKALATWAWNEHTKVIEVKLWDPATGRQRAELKGFRAHVITAAFSPDGKILATGGGSLGFLDRPPVPTNPTELKLWDVGTGKERSDLTGGEYPVDRVAFSPDGRRLATAGGDLYGKQGEVRVWDVAAGKQVAELTGHTDAVNAVTFSPDGKLLAYTDSQVAGLARGACVLYIGV